MALEYFKLTLIWQCSNYGIPQGVPKHYSYMGAWLFEGKVNIQYTFYIFFYMNVINLIAKFWHIHTVRFLWSYKCISIKKSSMMNLVYSYFVCILRPTLYCKTFAELNLIELSLKKMKHLRGSNKSQFIHKILLVRLQRFLSKTKQQERLSDNSLFTSFTPNYKFRISNIILN